MDAFFNHYAEKYDAWYDRYPAAYESELAVLRHMLPREGRGLDIGVGTGRFALPLNISAGIDPSPRMVDIAVRRGVRAHVGYGEDLPFTNRSFDYVVIIFSLCFMNDPCAVLREARRVLTEDGCLLTGFINKDSFLGRHYQEKKGSIYERAHFYNAADLDVMLRQTGFDAKNWYQTLFTLPEKMTVADRFRAGTGQGGFLVVKADVVKGAHRD